MQKEAMPSAAEIQVFSKDKMNEISPLLYGVFFEDINYGGDGGLYAELIPNRSFEYYDKDGKTDKYKMCWEPVGDTRFEIGTDKPLNNVHTHYAELNGTVRNIGYCGAGFGVRMGEAFNLSLFAAADRPHCISVRILSENAQRLAETVFEVKTAEWTKFEAQLIAEHPAENAVLEIETDGEVRLEFVSLFPADTYKGRKNGMRRDIAEMIAELHPAFMRFPGGCIVEGRSFDNMYNWKDTIGPIEARRTNWNRWQSDEYQQEGRSSDDYFQSYGIGFYEYFQFCEDIGAKPLPVVNCGMTCQWHEALLVDMDKLAPFVQDVFDLIEFANGSENSEWGRKRIEMGHPEPFGLEYIGIGNEQWGAEYFERYEVFQKAVSARYPEIRLVTSAGWKDHGEEFDLAYDWMRKNKDKAYAVDEHFYKEPEWFLGNINRYDSYDRMLPKVFIGEYAAHTARDKNDRRNNWYAALCEAAFLTGVERNADHVVMTCYAPLLAKMGHQQWQPDLIWFDNTRVFGTPNYYVQKLFSDNRGDYAVRYECGDSDIKTSACMKGDKLIVKLVNISETEKAIRFTADVPMAKCRITELAADKAAENDRNDPRRVYPVSYESDCVPVRIKGYSVLICEMTISG